MSVKMIDAWKRRVRQLKAETYALYLAYRDPRVPWYARLFAVCVVGYAFCPIDLIPDFVPVLGYLDDLLLVPLGIVLALKMIPPAVMAECRAEAQEVMAQGRPFGFAQGRLFGFAQGRPVNRAAAVIVVAIWLLLAALSAAFVLRVARLL